MTIGQVQKLPVAILIPAYKPGRSLVDLVVALAGTGMAAIIVVDDGSGPQHRAIFDELLRLEDVHVLRHAVNLGKGAALKTGINYALVEYPSLAGVVTADADGQHDPADIAAVAKRFIASPEALVLGARTFAGDVPLRSRFGNSLTRVVLHLVVGHRITDTQTGLRAIPRGLLERLLPVAATGYEFELEMLIAARHLRIEVIEQPIRTIYEPGNPTSHFQPLRDSMRIYFVLLRFGFISLLTSGIDNVAFYVLYRAAGVVPVALFGARLLALLFNYTSVRNAVFLSREQHRIVLPRYLLLAAANVCLSYALISFLTNSLNMGVMPAKVSVETLLFFANFAIQRDFVFARPGSVTARSGAEGNPAPLPLAPPGIAGDAIAGAAELNADVPR